MVGDVSRRQKRWLQPKDWVGLLFSCPLIIGMAAFAVYPMVAALLLSFQESNGISGTWVGLDNYSRIFRDLAFWRALSNTFYMAALSVLLGTFLSFVLASLINSLPWNRSKNFFKSIFFLPNVVSAVATSILFSFLLYPENTGLLNYVAGLFGIEPVGWFTDPAHSRNSMVLLSLWSSLGYNTIIFFAALQSVPKHLYEAAEVDGADGVKRWWHITIPYVRPIFLFVIIISTINGMKRFTDVWLIGGTAGNPDGTLMTAVLYIYRYAFVSSEMGIASAASYILFLVILVLTGLMLKTNKKASVD